MTPTHTNKRGARYRYYVSHAILQKRSDEAGVLTRISAPDQLQRRNRYRPNTPIKGVPFGCR